MNRCFDTYPTQSSTYVNLVCLSLSSYVYKCVCQQHSELLYNDLTTKIASHLQQVSASLQVSKCKSTKSVLGKLYFKRVFPFSFSGQPTGVLNWELQHCFHAIHSFSSVYSSCVYVLGMHLFIYVLHLQVSKCLPIMLLLIYFLWSTFLKTF